MKRTLLFACVVAAMASCSKNEVENVNSQDPNVINFTSYVGTTTKAGETTTANILDAGVYALSLNKTAFTDPFMPNVELSRATTSDDWKTTGVYYWPTSGDVSFYAYSPYCSAATITDAGVVTDNGLAIATTADAQVDILAAKPVTSNKAANSAVGLTFDHMLSKVDFQIVVKSTEKASINFSASSFELVGVDGVHDGLDINESTPALVNSTATTGSSYTYAATQTALSASRTTAQTEVATIELNGTSANAFMLLPQTLTDWTTGSNENGIDQCGAAVKLKYNLMLNGEYIVGDGATDYVTAYFALPTTNVSEWKAGSSYLYTLTFDAEDLGDGGKDEDKDPILDGSTISFTVTVTAWPNEETTVTPNLNNDPDAAE
ncbi:MAG: fimbrillin family protein [Rikenellaceae bacterium]